MTKKGLSSKATLEISRALAGLSDAEADRVAVLLEERGPLAGALKAPWETGAERVPQTRDEVEHLVIIVFEQHALDATESDREESDLAMLFEAVADVQRQR